MNSTLIQELEKLDGLRILKAGNKKVYLHNEHRWVLPILWAAQESGELNKSCTHLMFDRHHDFANIAESSRDKIATMVQAGTTQDNIIELCNYDLCKANDDWIRAGMELGLIGSSVTFGAAFVNLGDDMTFLDHACNRHSFYQLGHPGDEMGGRLGDIAVKERHEQLWRILGWEHISGYDFDFTPSSSVFWLDIDLDCFAVEWNGYKFPWPDKIWANTLRIQSQYSTPNDGWGLWFIRKLIDRASLITIAREPRHCGSEAESDQILEKVNENFFDGAIEL